MSFTSEWIAPLIESCLQSFAQRPVPGVELEDVRWHDDGSNIRFFNYRTTTTTQALILNVSYVDLGGTSVC